MHVILLCVVFQAALFSVGLQAEVETAVRLEAFARIAPAIPVLADIITVHSQWEALTNTTGGLLPFPVYDKYLSELDK